MATATFTDLLRSPKTVAAQADFGAVTITRRDAADLVLMRAGDLDGMREGVALASQVMRAALAHQGDMPAALDSILPWASSFSPEGRVQFATEISQLVWSAAELGEYSRLLQAYHAWRETAAAIAAGLEPVASEDWLAPSDYQVVPRP